MARLRILSVVKDTRGYHSVYGEEKEPSKMDICISPSKEIPIKSKSSIHVDVYDGYDHMDSEEVQQIDYYGLSYLEASLFATILEHTIMEIQILMECNNELRVWKMDADMKLLIAIKFNVDQPETKDELEGIDPHFLENSDYKLNKLEADRKYLKEVIVTVYKEMTLYKTFDMLRDYVNGVLKDEHDRMALIEDQAKNKVLRRDLNKHLRQQRNHIKTIIYDADTTINLLNTKLEDSSLNAEICNRYVENWQRARTEQNLQTIQDTESYSSNSIEYYKLRTDYENERVHPEVELLVNISINETLQKIDKLMAKYDNDMEEIDLKIRIKKNDYQDLLDKRIDLENTIEKHDIMMKEWINFKEEREKARLYREKMTNSAIVVQAWWRGLLVRCQLGPFKVVTKKGRAGDKKKKK